jgi:hypothetical protein
MNDLFLRVVVAAAVGCFHLTVSWGRFNAWSTMIGLVLVTILLTVPFRRTIPWTERATLSAAWSLALLLALGRFVEPLAQASNLFLPRLILGCWLVLAVLLFAVGHFLARRTSDQPTSGS